MSERGKKPGEPVDGRNGIDLLPGQTQLDSPVEQFVADFLIEDLQVPQAKMIVRSMYEQHGIDAARRVYEYLAAGNRRIGNMGRRLIMPYIESLHRTHMEDPESFKYAMRRRGNWRKPATAN